MLFTMIIILLMVVQPSYQVVYSCDPTVVCGCSSNPASVTRIVGGETAGKATWGWAVSISLDASELCGGSILSSSWIITAAHCMNDYTASQVIVYAGSTLRWFGTQNRSVSRIIIHPNYNSVTYTNDIALLQLASPLTMSDPNVSPICVPSVSSTTLSAGEWPITGTIVVAVGWGRLSEGGLASSTLQQVTLQTVDYRALTCAPSINDKTKQFCAGVYGGGKDTCQGDSGGPLMMFSPNHQWLLVGLTSFGDGCARPESSGVYTRVAAYDSWIRSNTNDSFSSVALSHANNLQTSVYCLLFFLFNQFCY